MTSLFWKLLATLLVALHLFEVMVTEFHQLNLPSDRAVLVGVGLLLCAAVKFGAIAVALLIGAIIFFNYIAPSKLSSAAPSAEPLRLPFAQAGYSTARSVAR